MSKINKIIMLTVSIFCFLMLISSVSAADLVVNGNTSHKNITDWLDDTSTVNGNSLIFDVSSYELSDTLKVNKSINIKSDKKTQINFNQNNKPMFNITANEINFSGLILNNNGASNHSNPARGILVSPSGKTSTIEKIITIKDTSINLKNDDAIAITVWFGKLNFIDSNIKSSGRYSFGIVSENLTINFQKSSIIFTKNNGTGVFIFNKLAGNFINSKITLHSGSVGIYSPIWTGNFINSQITGKSMSHGLLINKWNGKISNSKIIMKGAKSFGVYLENSKGTISKSTIHVKKYVAVSISKNVKVSKSSIKSKKMYPNIYYFGPRVIPYKVSSFRISNKYTIKVVNFGEYKSKKSQLVISVGKYKKTIKIKGLKVGKSVNVKITIPEVYANKKYKKVAKIIFYNGAKKKETSYPLYFKF